VRSALVHRVFQGISQAVIRGASFLYVGMRIASFYDVLGSFGGFNILHFHFYISIRFGARCSQNCPVRTRKVLLVAPPAMPACTARPTSI